MMAVVYVEETIPLVGDVILYLIQERYTTYVVSAVVTMELALVVMVMEEVSFRNHSNNT